jgi:hypothetical protein
MALLLWVLALTCCALLYGPARAVVRQVARQMFGRKILIMVMFTAFYFVAVVRLAGQVGLWSGELLATTLIWVIPSLWGVGMRALSATKEERFFRRALRGLVGGAVVIEFLVNAETFPLWWELIQLPIIARTCRPSRQS